MSFVISQPIDDWDLMLGRLIDVASKYCDLVIERLILFIEPRLAWCLLLWAHSPNTGTTDESRIFDQGMDFMFSRVLTGVVFSGLLTIAVQPVDANHGWGHHYHGYRGPVFGVAVVAPPPVIVAPSYMYAPAYAAPPVPLPPPVPVPPPVVVPAPAPVYAPTYSYGIMGGPRGVGFGYSSPGFGVYMGR